MYHCGSSGLRYCVGCRAAYLCVACRVRNARLTVEVNGRIIPSLRRNTCDWCRHAIPNVALKLAECDSLPHGIEAFTFRVLPVGDDFLWGIKVGQTTAAASFGITDIFVCLADRGDYLVGAYCEPGTPDYEPVCTSRACNGEELGRYTEWNPEFAALTPQLRRYKIKNRLSEKIRRSA